jgi:Dehydrogenases with different specificities (related to short-chain alcohol dehydrogenases)
MWIIITNNSNLYTTFKNKKMENLFNISGKVIIITGGYGVLGRGISMYLAQQGAKIVIIGRSQEEGDALVSEIKKQGGQAMFAQADVTDKAMLEDCKKQVLKNYGKIDILINAAGGNMPGATIAPSQTIFDLNIDAMKTVVDLNLFGTVLPTMVFADEMAKQKEGVILNFSSESSLRPLTRVAGYGVAKAAVNNFTQYMAGELAIKFGNGIRMNAVAPGFFLTNQNRALMLNPDGSLSDRAKSVMAHTPFNRFGEPEDLFGTVHYLISDASKFVTGTVAVVDGGFNAFTI